MSTAPLISSNQSAYGGVTGTCSENGLAVVVAIASLVVSPAPLCVGGSWSITGVDVSSVPDGGVVTVSASQTDAAGNTGSGTRDTSKDATAPTVAITSAPPINVSNSGNYAVSGSCSESGLPVQVSVGSIVVIPPPVCNGGTWSVGGINATALPEGQCSFRHRKLIRWKHGWNQHYDDHGRYAASCHYHLCTRHRPGKSVSVRRRRQLLGKRCLGDGDDCCDHRCSGANLCVRSVDRRSDQCCVTARWCRCRCGDAD